MKRVLCLVSSILFLVSCDLRQAIVDAPGDVGDFIASRYPALLADPNTEIYQYASVLDYGNPADMYGSPQTEYGDKNDYISYENLSDYQLPEQSVKQTMISEVSKDYGTLVVSEKKSFVLNTATVRVKKGDTVYSIAKKYNMTPQRLAAINNLSKSYQLSIGQNLKVESAQIVTAKTEITKTESVAMAKPVVRNATPVIKSNAAVKLPKISERASSKFAMPVKGKIISGFGPKQNGLANDGINIGAKIGTPVLAAENGVVAYAGNEIKGMGNLLIIQHSGGWMTVYAHLDDFMVKRGDKVSIRQKIGTVGNTGKIDESQLHFEIRKGSKAYDPQKLIK